MEVDACVLVLRTGATVEVAVAVEGINLCDLSEPAVVDGIPVVVLGAEVVVMEVLVMEVVLA